MYFQPGALEMGQHFWGGDRNIPDREGTTSTTSRGSTRSVGLSRNPNPPHPQRGEWCRGTRQGCDGAGCSQQPGVQVEERVAEDFSEGLGDGDGVCAGENTKKKSPADFWGVREEVFSSTEILREGWQHMGLGDGGVSGEGWRGTGCSWCPSCSEQRYLPG